MFQKATLGALGFCTFYFFTCFSTLFFSLLKLLDLYQNRKINPVRRILGKSIQDCFCVFFCFCSGFCCPKPNCPKTRGKPKKKQKKTKKNNPVRRILGKSIQDCFFVFFGLFGFSRGFCCPKPNCPKTRGKPKNNNPVRRILGKSIQDWFFVVFWFIWFIWFFSRFLLSQAQLSKNSRKTPKKKQSCEKNLG